MKKFKVISALFVLLSFMACDQDDANVENIYDNNGQTGVGFTTASASVSVRPEGSSVTLDVQSTTTSTSERNFDVIVNGDTTGNISDFTLGSIIIPAGEYNGTLDVSFVDDNLVDGVAYTAVLDLDLPAGVAVVGAGAVTINYNKYLLCNDFVLTINDDSYSDERSWDVTDATGNIVVEGGGYSFISGGQLIVETMTLEDGCYTFTIYDSYADGQFDGNMEGNYSLDCSIINAASGGGNWGASESTEFCVNP